MNKQEVEALIDRLASKELSFGCEIITDDGDKHIYICDEQSDNGYCTIDERPEYTSVYLHESGFLESKIFDNQIDGKWEKHGHPVRIGDVLEKLDIVWGNRHQILFKRWFECGISKSLQQIVEESGYDEKTEYDPNRDEVDIVDSRLKSTEARALFSYLAELFPSQLDK